jgi:outer membrane protein OmpA-like peptidoglycan-associated protein
MLRRSFLRLGSASLASVFVPLQWTRAHSQLATTSEADRIAEALRPRRRRGVVAMPSAPGSIDALDRLKDVRKTRGLSHREQDELHLVTQAMPQLDLEIYFSFNSAEIEPKALPTLSALGEALNRDALKNSTIVIGGHTDRKGTPDINQLLSDRRAQAIARHLSVNYKIVPGRILATGFGFRKLKLPDQPYADANRRVQIVNATP